MRTKKATINVLISVISFVIGFLPIIFVRKVFINELGSDLLGLSSLYTNIIGYLSIVEMGIGSAIIFSLYKPYADNDWIKINALLKHYKKMYQIIGVIVLAAGLVMLPILDLFITDSINMTEARLYFLLFLVNTVIGYYFSYKFCVPTVAQEGYRVTIANTIAKLGIAIMQIIGLLLVHSFYLYLAIQIIGNLIFYIGLSLYIDSKYTSLKRSKVTNLEVEEKSNLNKNIKALMFHKIGGVVVFGTDNLIISSFINLSAVARYSNYSLIIGAIQGMTSTAMTGITSSIGNLLVEKDRDAAYIIHKRLFFVNFWIVSMITIVLFNMLTPFVILWLGEGQTIDKFTLFIVIANMYFQLMRGSVERFYEGGGSYYRDRYAPIFELSINLIASLLLVNLLGLPGVFLGTLISNLTVVFWVKPKVTYKYIFKVKLRKYFVMYLKYLFIALIPFLICYFITSSFHMLTGAAVFFVECILNLLVINIFYLLVFWRNEEFIYFKNLLIKRKDKKLVMNLD